MTYQEAIKELIDILLGYPMASPRYEALELAIEVLQRVVLLEQQLTNPYFDPLKDKKEGRK